MCNKIVGLTLMAIVIGLVACGGSSSNNSTTTTASNFVGTWNGSIIYSGVNDPTTLTLSSDLTGSYLRPVGFKTYNLTTPCLVSDGTLSFNLPVSVEDASNNCAAWAVSCMGTLSDVRTTLTLTCSGLLCNGTPYSYADVMTKQ